MACGNSNMKYVVAGIAVGVFVSAAVCVSVALAAVAWKNSMQCHGLY